MDLNRKYQTLAREDSPGQDSMITSNNERPPINKLKTYNKLQKSKSQQLKSERVSRGNTIRVKSDKIKAGSPGYLQDSMNNGGATGNRFSSNISTIFHNGNVNYSHEMGEDLHASNIKRSHTQRHFNGENPVVSARRIQSVSYKTKPNMSINRNASSSYTRKANKVAKINSMKPLDPTYVLQQLQNSSQATSNSNSIAENENYSQSIQNGNDAAPTHYSNQNTYIPHNNQHNSPQVREDHTANSQAYTRQYVNNINNNDNDNTCIPDSNNNNNVSNNISRINSIGECRLPGVNTLSTHANTTSILRNKIDKNRSFAHHNKIDYNNNHRHSNGSNINRTNTISIIPNRGHAGVNELPLKKKRQSKIYRNKSERVFERSNPNPNYVSNLVRNHTDAKAYYSSLGASAKLQHKNGIGNIHGVTSNNNTIVFRHDSIVGNGKSLPYVIPEGVTYENLCNSKRTPSVQDLATLAKYDLANSPNLSRTDSKLPILDNATLNSSSSQEKLNLDLIKQKKSLRKSMKDLAKIQKQLSRKGTFAGAGDISVVTTDDHLAAPEVTIIYPEQQFHEKLGELVNEPLSREKRIKYLVLMLIVFICISVAVFGSVVYLKNVFDKRKLATDAQDSGFIEFFNSDKNTDLH